MEQPCILIFELSDEADALIKRFSDSQLEEWKAFVMNNKNPACRGLKPAYDVIFGPICRNFGRLHQGGEPQPMTECQYAFFSQKGVSPLTGILVRV